MTWFLRMSKHCRDASSLLPDFVAHMGFDRLVRLSIEHADWAVHCQFAADNDSLHAMKTLRLLAVSANIGAACVER